jgi:glutathione synthase/RimK-type ligase-like ATP-grasp enzyme
MRHVVIVAAANDEHASVVAKRVECLGARPVILDTADFPHLWRLTFEISTQNLPRFVLEHDGVEVDQDNLAGVWWRRPRRYLAAGDIVESHLRQFVTMEAREAFEGWLLSLGRRVINSPAAEAAARKIVQLQVAAQAGLRIPRTLATNSPKRARVFCEGNGSETVFKPFTAPFWRLIPTQRITADTYEHLDAVAHAPVIFQEQIQKIADVRVAVVDGEMFAVRLQSTREDGPIDWRVDADLDCARHSLPTPIEHALRQVLLRLGWRFAACDLGLMSDGEYVFFEANPGGQWLHAEIMVGHPISTSLARALLQAGC